VPILEMVAEYVCATLAVAVDGVGALAVRSGKAPAVALNVAVTVFEESIWSAHGLEPLQAPDQPANVLLPISSATKSTLAP